MMTGVTAVTGMKGLTGVTRETRVTEASKEGERGGEEKGGGGGGGEEEKYVTIAGQQTNELTRKDRATQSMDHGRLKRAIEGLFLSHI